MSGSTGKGRALPSRPWTVLAMLLVVYFFNFVDRQILAILAAPIQADLQLSDAQMGALGGIAFALLFSTMALPFAALADRFSRSWVVTGALVAWSGFTALCGLAQGFWPLFLARLGVGVGEAGGVAPSHALIGEYFPSARRGLALSIYSLGAPLGSAAGVMAGGYIAATVDWRLAFLVVGLAGIATAPLFKWLVRDPPPRAFPDETRAGLNLRDTARMLSRKRSFWLLALGGATASMMGYGITFWLPSLLQRSFGFDLVGAARFYGALLLIGGCAGVLLGGWLGDRLGKANPAYYAYVPGLALLICAPLYAIGLFAPGAAVAFAMFLVPQALSLTWLGPVFSATQHLVTPPARSMAAALLLLLVNLIGMAGGIFGLGALSDMLTPLYGEQALRFSMLYGLAIYLVAGALLLWAGRGLRADWVAETPVPQPRRSAASPA